MRERERKRGKAKRERRRGGRRKGVTEINVCRINDPESSDRALRLGIKPALHNHPQQM
jgi:hypothetical protein